MRQLKIVKSITNRQVESLDKYLQDISKVELISAEEEVILAQKIKAGDTKAFDKLVKANLRFVVSVAKQYQNQGLGLPDLINEGNLGLIKAAQKFDETKGFKFISYAVWWIRQTILQAIAEQSRIIRLPLNQIGSLNRILKEISLLEQKLGRKPSEDEIADALLLPKEKLSKALRLMPRHYSVDAPLIKGEEGTMIDILPDSDTPETDSGLIYESLNKEILRSLNTLTEKEREVIKLFYGIGMAHGLTLDEIGHKQKMSRERVRQVREKAIKRLKSVSKNKLLKSYLGE